MLRHLPEPRAIQTAWTRVCVTFRPALSTAPRQRARVPALASRPPSSPECTCRRCRTRIRKALPTRLARLSLVWAMDCRLQGRIHTGRVKSGAGNRSRLSRMPTRPRALMVRPRGRKGRREGGRAAGSRVEGTRGRRRSKATWPDGDVRIARCCGSQRNGWSNDLHVSSGKCTVGIAQGHRP